MITVSSPKVPFFCILANLWTGLDPHQGFQEYTSRRKSQEGPPGLSPRVLSGPRGRLPTASFMIDQIPRCRGSTPDVTPNAAGTQLDPRPTWKLEEHGLVTINSYLVTFYGHLDCISGNFMHKC